MKFFAVLEASPKRRLWRFLLLLLGALSCGLCLVTQKLDVLEWIALVPAVIALLDIARDDRIKKRGLYGYGFFFFFCFYVVCFHWFVDLYPLEFINGMTKPSALAVVFLGCFGLSALQAVGAGVAFVIFSLEARRERFRNHALLQALLLAGLWTVLEWSQTIGWIGVPWARLSIGQMGLYVGAQSSSLLGCCFVTFLIVFVNFLAAWVLVNAEKRRLFSIVAASCVAVNFLVGAIIYIRDSEKGEPIKVAAIQGNISSSEKWDSSYTFKTLDVYEKYTAEAAAAGAHIVIWPESALPYNITNNRALLTYASDIARENKVTLLVGAFTYEGDDEYNSIVTFLDDGSLCETVYSKRHLVPFGEYVPHRAFFETALPVLTELAMLPYDLAEGESANVIKLDGVSIGSLICFDSIYDELARDSVRNGAEFLAISTNDSWFSDSAALRMHNAQAALRSIENGRYTVRAANTGISSVIAPNGESIEALGALEEGFICAEIYPQSHRTLYSYVGNSFVYICIIWVFWCCFCEKISLNLHKALDKKKIK